MRQVGDRELRRPAQPVRRVNRSVRAALDIMTEAMAKAGGVGLAGPQLGMDRRLVVLEVNAERLELCNPEIVRAEGMAADWEGCLSVPGLAGLVPRYEKVTVRALDARGRRTWIEADGLLARALQHEIDHLDGILFLDRAESFRYGEDCTEEGQPPAPRRGGPAGPTLPVPRGRLRLVFMGTPAFALPALSMLIEGNYHVVAVVTQPDRPAGRGRHVTPPPVKAYAAGRGIPLLQPTGSGCGDLGRALEGFAPDLVVTVAFGRLLPPEVLALPPLGCVNLHASLLPRHRGAAPIPWAIVEGDTLTGVSTFYMDEGLDTGDVVLRRATPIRQDDTAGVLHDRLALQGAGLLEETVRLCARGVVPRLPQCDAEATVARRLTPADEKLCWERPATVLERWVRALAPSPGAYTTHRGRRLKVRRARVAQRAGCPGEVLAVEPDGVTVAAGEGSLILEEVQPEGGRAMAAVEYARGRCLEPGETLGG